MKFQLHFYHRPGLTLVELLIAVALFTTVMVIATGLFGRVVDNQSKTASSKSLQENVDYAVTFMRKEAEGAKKSLDTCGGCSATTSFFCQPNANEVYFRNKNEVCVHYFLQTDSNNIQRLAVTRNALPASPYFLYLTPTDTIVQNLSFDSLSIPDLAVVPDAPYVSAKLTIAIEAKPVIGITADTLNVQTTVAIKPFVCGDTITDRDNFTYKTVQIGEQCWMAENLKTRTKPDGTCINISSGMYTVSPAPNCLTITNGTLTTKEGFSGGNGVTPSGRECIDSTTSTQGESDDCNAGHVLYRWAAAMDGSTTAGARGICPLDWHLPTSVEQLSLINYVGDVSTAGQYLRSLPAVANASGYDAILIGDRDSGNGNVFSNVNRSESFWSSSGSSSPSGATNFLVANSDDQAQIQFVSKTWGLSLRCLRD